MLQRELAVNQYQVERMKSNNTQMKRGRMPFRLAVGTLLIFLALGGAASALSNDGGELGFTAKT